MAEELRPASGPTPEESLERQHEQRDLAIPTLFISLLGLGVLVLAAALGMKLFQVAAEDRARARDPRPSPMVEQDVTPPQPRLETAPGSVLQQLRAMESVQLGDYGWVDQASGIARLPIARAMEIVAERRGDVPLGAAPPLQTQEE